MPVCFSALELFGTHWTVQEILDELLHRLVMILEGSTNLISELHWGEETNRLPPASVYLNRKANAYPNKDQPVLPLSDKVSLFKVILPNISSNNSNSESDTGRGRL